MTAPKKTIPLGRAASPPRPKPSDPGLMETGVALGKTVASMSPQAPHAQAPDVNATVPERTIISPGQVPQATARPADTHIGATHVQELAATMAGTGAPPTSGDPYAASTRSTELEHRLLGAAGEPGRIGRFAVLRKLGEGGMGMVFSAFDEDLDRRVAIKLLLDEGMTGTQGRARIKREAQAMAKLNHPNVVQVYEVNEWEGKIYVVMEFVKGETLGDWTHDTPHPWKETLEMHLQAGRGLAAAHAVGIIHRDYKPDNVLVGEDNRARVLDFGLARATRTSESVDPGSSVVGAVLTDHTAEINTQLTIAGTIMGTPAYMSPEQHQGAPTDAHSDQFSFCVAVYEALYKQRPFDGDTLAALSMAVTSGELKPPPKSADVPPAVFDILQRGLAPTPGERFESMDTLLAELAHQLDPEAIVTGSRWRWPLITAISTMGAIGLTAFFMYGGAPTPEEEMQVDNLVEEARKAASEAHWVYPELDGDIEATSIRKVKALESLDGAAEDLGKEQATELRDVFASTLVSLGDRYYQNKASRPYAFDYYLQSLLFKDDPALRERIGMTEGRFLDFRLKALTEGFTPQEIREAGMLFALAEENEEKRQALIVAEAERLAQEMSSQQAIIIEGIVDAELSQDRRNKYREKRRKRVAEELGLDDEPPAADFPIPGEETADAAEGDTGEPEGDENDTDDAVEEPPEDKGSKRGTNKKKRNTSSKKVVKPPVDDKEPEQVVDEALSDQLTKEGQAALARGDLKTAESLFNQALSANNRNAAALIGLSDVFFERSAHRRAVKYAEKAVRLAPGNSSYRIRLGDAYFKVLRYADARKAYEKAKSLGNNKADGRLTKVKAQLGE